ncbi:hypothetical protein [Candidatus Phytoplasma prunorum]|uniref:hypothetical protein n=1 Tax=Candidatus Phytoplasma prunorum TaxID=47565 RepID=UPI002FF186AD
MYQKKSHNFFKICCLMIGSTLIMAVGISAVTSYFARTKIVNIKLAHHDPLFTIDRTGGNEEDKTLIALPKPNFDPSTEVHLINFSHVAQLDTTGCNIKVPLYLSVKIQYDTHNTIANPENCFNSAIKINGVDYDHDKKPQMIITDNHGKIDLQFYIEQKESKPNGKLSIVCHYDLVDAQGASFTGGSQSIETKITNLN